MNTILAAIDFSAASHNAAVYAVSMKNFITSREMQEINLQVEEVKL